MLKRSILAAAVALVTVLGTSPASAAEPAEATGPAGYAEALSQAKQLNLPLLLDFGAEH